MRRAAAAILPRLREVLTLVPALIGTVVIYNAAGWRTAALAAAVAASVVVTRVRFAPQAAAGLLLGLAIFAVSGHAAARGPAVSASAHVQQYGTGPGGVRARRAGHR